MNFPPNFNIFLEFKKIGGNRSSEVRNQSIESLGVGSKKAIVNFEQGTVPAS